MRRSEYYLRLKKRRAEKEAQARELILHRFDVRPRVTLTQIAVETGLDKKIVTALADELGMSTMPAELKSTPRPRAYYQSRAPSDELMLEQQARERELAEAKRRKRIESEKARANGNDYLLRVKGKRK